MPTPDAPLPDFDALWDYDNPSATEHQFRALLERAELSGDRSYHAQLLSQIARSEGLQRKFDEAHATLDTAEGLLTKESGQARIRYLLERGRVFNSSGQIEQAKPLFLEAWELARAQDEDGYAVDAAHMLAIIAPPEQQHEWHLQALALAQQSMQPRARKWLGSLYNNIGWTYHEAGQHEQALDMFRQALAEREATGSPEQLRVARWCVARGLRSLGRVDEALNIQRQLLADLEQRRAADGYVYEELGECLLALSRQEEARPYFARAYAELSADPWLAESEPARIERLKELGNVPS
jgi:tetratricopeptide (TPR) repeat protein